MEGGVGSKNDISRGEDDLRVTVNDTLATSTTRAFA